MMTTIRLMACVAGFALIAAGRPVQAHHSFAAEFDAEQARQADGGGNES